MLSRVCTRVWASSEHDTPQFSTTSTASPLPHGPNHNRLCHQIRVGCGPTSGTHCGVDRTRVTTILGLHWTGLNLQEYVRTRAGGARAVTRMTTCLLLHSTTLPSSLQLWLLLSWSLRLSFGRLALELTLCGCVCFETSASCLRIAELVTEWRREGGRVDRGKTGGKRAKTGSKPGFRFDPPLQMF